MLVALSQLLTLFYSFASNERTIVPVLSGSTARGCRHIAVHRRLIGHRIPILTNTTNSALLYIFYQMPPRMGARPKRGGPPYPTWGRRCSGSGEVPRGRGRGRAGRGRAGAGRGGSVVRQQPSPSVSVSCKSSYVYNRNPINVAHHIIADSVSRSTGCRCPPSWIRECGQANNRSRECMRNEYPRHYGYTITTVGFLPLCIAMAYMITVGWYLQDLLSNA